MKKNPILIGKPRKHPEKLVNALIDFFKLCPDVDEAYLVQIFDPTSGKPPYISVGIIMNAHINSIATKLEEIVKSHCSDQEFIDFLRIDTSDLLESYSSVEPFYVSP